MDLTLIVVLVIALALFFDFTNGFHDTANAMATPIATGALKPQVAVAIAAVLNLVGAFLSTEVAKTVSGGMISEGDGGVQITPEHDLRRADRRHRLEHGDLAPRPAVELVATRCSAASSARPSWALASARSTSASCCRR